MNYIGVENPEIAKTRVRIRVKKGGHGIISYNQLLIIKVQCNYKVTLNFFCV